MLDIIKGDSIEFTQVPPNKHFASNPNFTKQEEFLIEKEIEKLIHKGIIGDGGIRLILNPKRMNEYVKYHHFKMESIRSVLNLVTKDCFYVHFRFKRCIL